MDKLPPVLRRTAGNAAPPNRSLFLHFRHMNGTKVSRATLLQTPSMTQKEIRKKTITCFNRFAPQEFYNTAAYLKHKNSYNPVRPGKLDRESKQRS